MKICANFFFCRSADAINYFSIFLDKLTSVLISVITALQSKYCHINCNEVVSLQSFLFQSVQHLCPCPVLLFLGIMNSAFNFPLRQVSEDSYSSVYLYICRIIQ